MNALLQRLTSQSAFPLTEALFLRLLGLVYVTAFGSLWLQIVGLIGSHGVLPAGQVMTAMREQLGSRAMWDAPSLFWFGLNDGGLRWCCAIGCVAAILMMLGVFARWAAAICWLFYISLVSIGQPFTSFQWDALLLESGFLALLAGASWLVWAYRFLLFRLMFESGLVKLLSHDPNWRNFHALRFHFMTQPLPNPLAYYVYRAPAWLLDSMTAGTLAIELVAPFFLFGPRILRWVGTGLLMLLQVLILLTGNYAFFNLLALALCLWGFDDRTFAPLKRFLRSSTLPQRLQPALNIITAMLIVIGGIQVVEMITPGPGRIFSTTLRAIAPFQIVNRYGLFAVMTTTRPEIIIEGSDDRSNWKEYSFPYKPGNLHRGLPFVAPHQPRLDWQMWFAALGTYPENTWVGGLMYRLLLGEESVLTLIDPPPFTKPPHYMRAQLYLYDFTVPEERARTGAVWQRRLEGTWFGPVSLIQKR